jgi:hypothetical protein
MSNRKRLVTRSSAALLGREQIDQQPAQSGSDQRVRNGGVAPAQAAAAAAVREHDDATDRRRQSQDCGEGGIADADADVEPARGCRGTLRGDPPSRVPD